MNVKSFKPYIIEGPELVKFNCSWSHEYEEITGDLNISSASLGDLQITGISIFEILTRKSSKERYYLKVNEDEHYNF